MFKFKYRLNDKDYLRFNRYHLENSVVGKETLLKQTLIGPFACLLFVVVSGIVTPYPLLIFKELTGYLLIASVIWIISAKRLTFLSLNFTLRNAKAKGRFPYTPERLLIFDDEQIQEITPDSEIKTKYWLVEKVGITKKAIYIYYNSVEAYIVPISVFSSENEKQKFIQFLNSKI